MPSIIRVGDEMTMRKASGQFVDGVLDDCWI